jgi:hypothetical protein
MKAEEARRRMPIHKPKADVAQSLPRISVEQFERNSAYKNLEKPFILTNAMKNWPIKNWQLPANINLLTGLLGDNVVNFR